MECCSKFTLPSAGLHEVPAFRSGTELSRWLWPPRGTLLSPHPPLSPGTAALRTVGVPCGEVNVTACRDIVSRLPRQQDCAQVVDAKAELGGLEARARVLCALGKSPGWTPGRWRGQAAAEAFGAGDKALSYPGALPKCRARYHRSVEHSARYHAELSENSSLPSHRLLGGAASELPFLSFFFFSYILSSLSV